MDAVTAITNDHRALEGLFEKLKRHNGDRAALVAQVKARLLAHSVAEEEHVYPALVRNEPQEKDEVYHGVHEHREAEVKLAAVEASVGKPGFDKALTEFVDAVTHHVEEEESEILPSLKKAVSSAKLEELGQQFEQRRMSELREAGLDESLSKDELYAQAQKAEIPGRSAMSKEELAKAVREHHGLAGR